MTMPTIGPRGGAGDSGAARPEAFTPQQHTALRVLAFLLIYGALVPPLAVLLWKVALSWTP